MRASRVLCYLIYGTTAILLDTKGPEIRTGFFTESAHGKISLVKGETLVLTSDYSFKGDSRKLACSYSSMARSVTVGQEILVADGSLVLTVGSVDDPVSVGRRLAAILLEDGAADLAGHPPPPPDGIPRPAHTTLVRTPSHSTEQVS